MTFIVRIGQKMCPNIFAPSALNGLSPSWSGVFARLITPPKLIKHPLYGNYRVTVLARDEEKRVAEYNFQKMINQHPAGSYIEL